MTTIETLRPGGWWLTWSEGANRAYDGTLRVDTRAVSGDLYERPPDIEPPRPDGRIPIFARDRYRAYLRVRRALAEKRGGPGGGRPPVCVQLDFDRVALVTHEPLAWRTEQGFSARLVPAGDGSLAGPVRNAAGEITATLTIGRIGPFLRDATIEIDRVAGVECPSGGVPEASWAAVFEAAGWNVRVLASDQDVAEPLGGSWTDGELHAAMLARRGRFDLDREWRYHLLCVRRLASGERGVMYDVGAGDANHVGREGAVIAADWEFPDLPLWGRVRGRRFAETVAYYRAALHELGHAMGLNHCTDDAGIMNTTEAIAGAAEAPLRFPDNVLWRHAAADRHRLAHLPDIWVRPGGLGFNRRYVAPIADAADPVESGHVPLDAGTPPATR